MSHLKPILSFSFILLLVLLASSCSQSPTNAKVEVNKSPNDDREYQYLLLDNKLKMVLISDPEAENPPHLLLSLEEVYMILIIAGPGSFFEHMLFIGTEKYPEPDSFRTLSMPMEEVPTLILQVTIRTTFDIKNSAFKEGLDRFAHFFINPTVR